MFAMDKRDLVAGYVSTKLIYREREPCRKNIFVDLSNNEIDRQKLNERESDESSNSIILETKRYTKKFHFKFSIYPRA